MSYYTERDSHIRDKAKLVLDLTNHATKKDHTTGIETFNLAAKKRLL